MCTIVEITKPSAAEMKRTNENGITTVEPKKARVDSGDSGAWSAGSDLELEDLACRVAESVLSPVPLSTRPGTPMVVGDISPPGGLVMEDGDDKSGTGKGTVSGGRVENSAR